jgi:hypothetical protein
MSALVFADDFDPNPPLFGSTPPVEKWIWLTWAGERNHTIPVVYISNIVFKIRWPEALVLTQETTYAKIADFSGTQLTRASCSVDQRPPFPNYSVMVKQRHQGQVISCLFLRADACFYIATIKNLASTATEVHPLDILSDNLGCAAIAQHLSIGSTIAGRVSDESRRGSIINISQHRFQSAQFSVALPYH